MDFKLLVAGEFYENEKKYLDMVEGLGLENKIMFTNNFVPREEVAHYFAVADLVVLPYLSATQSGIVQVAYHFEKPVLVTDVGGLKEVVPHGKVGYVCEKNPEIIAECIADFFKNERSEEFIRNIKTEKKRFSWKSMVSGIEDLAAELSGSSE
jgi:D-inositol-3-phosphate glycosyltransferase